MVKEKHPDFHRNTRGVVEGVKTSRPDKKFERDKKSTMTTANAEDR